MAKRVICAVLAALMVFYMIPVTAFAANRAYGSVPILIGYADVDYMAEQILKEIPTNGLGAKDKIKAVYDWIIKNCKRYDWDGTLYFNEAEVQTHLDGYVQSVNQALHNNEAIIRLDLESEFDVNAQSAFYSYDSNYYIAYMAYEMMLKRTGNCANFSSLLAVLLGHLGFDCRLVAGDFKNGDGSLVEHKWNYVLVDGTYYWLDVRIDHADSKNGNIRHNFFYIADTNEWAKRHIWDHAYTDQLAANALNIQKEYEAILSHTHTIEFVAACEPTCETDGVYDHYRCTGCGRVYSDAEGYNELESYEVVISALGHDWNNWVTLKESTWMESGLIQGTCTRDSSHIIEEKTKALGNIFTDVKAAAYYETPVVWATDSKITLGTSDTTFSPNMDCTRSQVVTFLWRTAGSPEPVSDINHFVDITQDKYYYKAVLWAEENGITLGTSDTTFSPDMTCTRSQVVTFLWRMQGCAEPQPTDIIFNDIPADKYYYKAVLWAVEKGITNGTTATTFSPETDCDRAQIVTFLYRGFGIDNTTTENEQ